MAGQKPTQQSNRLISYILIILFNFRAAKEVKKTQKASKKPAAAAAAKAKPKQPQAKASKNVQKAAPRVGGKR